MSLAPPQSSPGGVLALRHGALSSLVRSVSFVPAARCLIAASSPALASPTVGVISELVGVIIIIVVVVVLLEVIIATFLFVKVASGRFCCEDPDTTLQL